LYDRLQGKPLSAAAQGHGQWQAHVAQADACTELAEVIATVALWVSSLCRRVCLVLEVMDGIN